MEAALVAPTGAGRKAQSSRKVAVGVATLALGLCVVALSASPSANRSMAEEAAAAEEPVCEWGYSGPNGPENWGTMCDKKYPWCAAGQKQSPINIKTLRTAKGPGGSTLGWKIPSDAWSKYVLGGKGDYLEEYNGHTFEVAHVDATFQFGGVIYKLQQFNTHTVSEHTVDGEHYDMEMHFVHTTDDFTAINKVLVVAVFFKVGAGQGSPNWLVELSKSVGGAGAEPAQIIPLDFTEVAQSVMVGTLPQNAHFKDFKPNYNNYWGYEGSFTTPPCTQGVQWLVLTNPVLAEAAEIDLFKAKEGDNFRPVQPLNNRVVTVRQCGLQCE